ncbi:hypothetical protein B0J11DRAFT_594216 [Dendryphion nanum]|uniref:SRR1-like domain-containing protein n=1 Tax=Dendryphion nanum TaxID=256645 RepID=A0A9P9D9G3_9PLEO|nr:hypothetical protein B0J11DRAFT_594216 [Dendryphion nanum]
MTEIKKPNIVGLNVYLGGKPFINTNIIDVITGLWENIKNNLLNLGDEYTVIDSRGELHTLTVPKSTGKNHRLAVEIVDQWKFAENLDNEGRFRAIDNDICKCPCYIKILENSEDESQNIKQEHLKGGPWWHWGQQLQNKETIKVDRVWWINCDTSEWGFVGEEKAPRRVRDEQHITGIFLEKGKELRTLLLRHKKVLKDVDQVLCFALGKLDFIRWNRRPWMQHVLAEVISATLTEIRENASLTELSLQVPRPPVEVYAYDPAYDEPSKIVLEEHLSINIRDFSLYKEITDKTFVICITPSAPVCQIIADIADPLAMLCYPIAKNYLQCPEAEENFVDRATKRLVEYRERCFPPEKWGDFQAMMNTDKGEREYKSSMGRTPAELRVAGVTDGEEIAKSKYDSKWITKVCFGDLKLYVRKKAEK